MEDQPPGPPAGASSRPPGYGPSASGSPARPPPAYVGPPQIPWSGMALAAFVLNVTPCGLVVPGIVLGLLGLRHTRDNQRRGRWMAVTALTLAVPWLLLYATGIGLTSSEDDKDLTRTTARVGTCISFIREPRLYEAEFEDPQRGILVRDSCSSAHDGEIYGVITLSPSMLDKAGTGKGAIGELCDEQLLKLTGRKAAGQLGDRLNSYIWTGGIPAKPGDLVVCVLQDFEHRPLRHKALP